MRRYTPVRTHTTTTSKPKTSLRFGERRQTTSPKNPNPPSPPNWCRRHHVQTWTGSHCVSASTYQPVSGSATAKTQPQRCGTLLSLPAHARADQDHPELDIIRDAQEIVSRQRPPDVTAMASVSFPGVFDGHDVGWSESASVIWIFQRLSPSDINLELSTVTQRVPF